MTHPRSLCLRCGEGKELPLARCPACGHVPERAEQAVSMLLSTRLLSEDELDQVQARLRRGEPLRPSAARLQAAQALLLGDEPAPPRSLGRGELAGLALLGVLLSPVPLLVYAWSWRGHPAAGQALRVAGVVGLLQAVPWALVVAERG